MEKHWELSLESAALVTYVGGRAGRGPGMFLRTPTVLPLPPGSWAPALSTSIVQNQQAAESGGSFFPAVSSRLICGGHLPSWGQLQLLPEAAFSETTKLGCLPFPCQCAPLRD